MAFLVASSTLSTQISLRVSDLRTICLETERARCTAAMASTTSRITVASATNLVSRFHSEVTLQLFPSAVSARHLQVRQHREHRIPALVTQVEQRPTCHCHNPDIQDSIPNRPRLA